ncbi:hypothetical protein IQ62_08495 [Streptomyces scabiei]|nr:hypothetical protein IQ62_08495 [Streptomyces scabiei]
MRAFSSAGLVVNGMSAPRGSWSRAWRWEHTATVVPLRPARRQDRIVWDSRSRVGSSTRTRPRGAMRAVVRAAMRVLPVPQAAITLARGWLPRTRVVAETASLWWGRSSRGVVAMERCRSGT